MECLVEIVRFIQALHAPSGKDIEMKLDRIYHERNACSTDYTIVEAVFIVAEFVCQAEAI